MAKAKYRFNDDAALVAKILEGLKRTGGYCPCRIQHIPENICICAEFEAQLEDPNFHGPCHCGLYVKD